ncbi:MAG: trypsin-like peptidase domain-containing protein, partial [Patescibacteria group bacterium]
VAVLKVNAQKLPVVKLGDSSGIELGEGVIAVGNALGLFKNTVSTGIISGLSRSIKAATDPFHVQELRGLIQTDAAINPGNSGGPLVNMSGNAIGINTAIVFGAQNLGFSIPINAARRDLADVKKFGRIRRPLLGLRYITIDENMQEKMKLPVANGAIVLHQGPHSPAIIPNSPAHKAGIKEKDIILECNDQKITPEQTIQDLLEVMNVGDIMNLKVLRDNKELSLKIVLAERK